VNDVDQPDRRNSSEERDQHVLRILDHRARGVSDSALEAEHAAWFAVTNAILNLDETMTR